MTSPLKEKPRLTEQEKKNNHIASEQKRRQAIRDGFDRLANLVPGLQGLGRSENIVLSGTLEYLKQNLVTYKDLLQEAERQGVDIADLKIEGAFLPDDSTPSSR